ncbi:hypothetical protein Tco_1006581 [Tanacetum coccineum]|uniref:F-box protein n=1 Tax=Tanacetum coccineum TaxID=301880 RepID=A0ABQ5FJH4_9ASTR
MSLITSPSFTLRLRNQRLPKIDPVCGLFLQQSDSSAFAPLDDRITASPFGSIITHAGSHFSVSQSCNGLLLCKNIHTFRECLVYNPFTNIFKSIQLPPELHQYNYCKDDTKFKLAFDPTKSCHYKLICVILTGDSCHIPTYSSKTGKWSITGIQFSAYTFRCFEMGVYWNNAIHWLWKDDRNEQPCHMVLRIEAGPWINTCLKTLELADGSNAHMLFESRGCLLLLVRNCDAAYYVFEMRNEYSGWSMKYSVYLDDIDPRVQMLSSLCVVLGEREKDSFMVVEVYGNVLQYKFLSKTVSTLRVISVSYILSSGNINYILNFLRLLNDSVDINLDCLVSSSVIVGDKPDIQVNLLSKQSKLEAGSNNSIVMGNGYQFFTLGQIVCISKGAKLVMVLGLTSADLELNRFGLYLANLGRTGRISEERLLENSLTYRNIYLSVLIQDMRLSRVFTSSPRMIKVSPSIGMWMDFFVTVNSSLILE